MKLNKECDKLVPLFGEMVRSFANLTRNFILSSPNEEKIKLIFNIRSGALIDRTISNYPAVSRLRGLTTHSPQS